MQIPEIIDNKVIMIFHSKKDVKSEAGFTLVEFAIVIVIIGLIVSGVLGARSLIESSKLRSTINDINKMKTAVRAYKLEFDSYPGMHTDAYDYFGDDCGNNSTNNVTGCNSDADKCISGLNSCNSGNAATSDIRRAMNHLSLSGIHPSLPTFSDSRHPENCEYGTVLPATAIGGGYAITSFTRGKIYLSFMKTSMTMNTHYCQFTGHNDTLATPKTLRSLDKKIDDENSIKGMMRNYKSYNSDNAFDSFFCSDSSTGRYKVENNTSVCRGFRFEIL